MKIDWNKHPDYQTKKAKYAPGFVHDQKRCHNNNNAEGGRRNIISEHRIENQGITDHQGHCRVPERNNESLCSLFHPFT